MKVTFFHYIIFVLSFSFYHFYSNFLDGIIMRHKTRNHPGSVFGAPAHFKESQLPTHEEVGRQYLQCKLDNKITNREAALEVDNSLYCR
jgi:hypothetical protein